MANDDVKEMLRAATIISYSSFEYESAVKRGDKQAARTILAAMQEGMNLANLANARMRRNVEAMPYNVGIKP